VTVDDFPDMPDSAITDRRYNQERKDFQCESGLSATIYQVQSPPLFEEQIRLEMEGRQ